jgi:polar amino acid transport system substrate-binding protein
MSGICLLLFSTIAVAPPAESAESAESAEQGDEWVLAHEDVAAHPWIHPDGSGLDVELITAAAEASGHQLRLESLPWMRCLAMLKAGQVDGLIAASYTPERDVYAQYPMLPNGQPDPTRRLHIDTYGLYKLAESPLDFDGERLINLDGRIAAQSGFSIISRLRDLGAEVDQDSKDLEPIMRRLLANRVVGAALLTTAVDHHLVQHPEFVPRIVKVPIDLVSKPYYLIFSDDHYRRSPEACEAMWAAIAELREGRVYQARLRQVVDERR